MTTFLIRSINASVVDFFINALKWYSTTLRLAYELNFI